MGSETDFQSFLAKFVNEHLSRPKEERIPPFRLVEEEVKHEEVPGHSCQWAAQYLYAHKCPIHWLNLICMETAKAVAEAHLSGTMCSSESGPAGDATTADGSSPETLLKASDLCQLTFQTVEETITKWLNNFPTKWTDVCSHHKHKISYHAIKNTRRKMEDRHCVVPLLRLFTESQDYEHSELYAVFDGHGGPDAAYYAAAQFMYNLIQQPGRDKVKALLAACAKTDTDFCNKAAREGLHSGTTGVVVLVDPHALYISWLGDSLAILVRSGRCVEIMDPHKPERQDEKDRIEHLGGSVTWYGTWRVNGNLAVSRAIGDVDHRPYISGVADCNRIQLSDDDEYIIVACDGLWDTVLPEASIQLVYEHIQSGKPHSTVAEMLVRAAKDEGSGDNITVIVVFFKDTLCTPVPPSDPCDVLENGLEGEPVTEDEKVADTDLSAVQGGETTHL